ncbi:hypothetical protein [Mucilaginibacter jinjuensis]|uniref:Lipocalin-like protein n=1 Tax=Mucilaginibacter jinjuensis TaxID=1176721 RepID=A0ABY7T9N6_9SPHI|nr:hypothetical protein [Mucilaginibacter jinjuensis]WCT12636.1 hypothetical protein PQO05_01665 [Mucilaginibacter jinjuensis]
MYNYHIKPFILLVFTVFVWGSCKSKSSHNTLSNTTTTSAKTAPTEEAQQLIKKFGPIINGVWVKQDYIDKVIKTKSPFEAMDLAIGLTTFKVSLDSIRGDSLVAHGGWDNHEGADMKIKFHSGKRASTILLNGSELGYEIHGRDTMLILYKTKTDDVPTTMYIRVLKRPFKHDGDLDDGLVYLMNKGLVAGKYFVIDSLGKKADVVLSPFGKITGLSSFKSYMIDYDLGGEPMNNLDGFTFDIYTKHQQSYTFKIMADTLSLYETRPNADSTLLLVDKLKYKLIRKR